MQIVHRVSLQSSPQIRRELAAMDILVAAEGFIGFDVEESHPNWPKLERWMKARGVTGLVTTRFTAAEIEQARWSELSATGHHGYPQPEDDYKNLTYDDSSYCKVCGTGLVQKAPFRMRKEPKWARDSILQLNWVFDEYFVAPELWREVFEPNGIPCRPVTNTKGAELSTIVQLDVREEVDISTAGLKAQACATCGREKFLSVTGGYFPRVVSESRADMVKTRQYFGSGASASHAVLVSQRLCRVLRDRKVRGVEYSPAATD